MTWMFFYEELLFSILECILGIVCSEVKDTSMEQLIVCYMLHLLHYWQSINFVYLKLYFEVFIHKHIYMLTLKSVGGESNIYWLYKE